MVAARVRFGELNDRAQRNQCRNTVESASRLPFTNVMVALSQVSLEYNRHDYWIGYLFVTGLYVDVSQATYWTETNRPVYLYNCIHYIGMAVPVM